MTDDELMRMGAEGNEEAFRLLVERWQGPVFVFLERMTGSKEDAQDLGQETFLRVCREAKRYRASGQFRSWLFRIAGNLARSKLRRRRIIDWVRFDPGTHDRPSLAPASDGNLVRKEIRSAVRNALERLPERQREAVVLKQYEGLSYVEIATAMGTTVSAVESLLHRAMVALREDLLREKVSD